MNEFGTPRFEAFVPKEDRKSGREAVEAVLRDLPPNTDVRSELDAVRQAMENTADHSSKEFYALQVRRTALLEFERGRELPRQKPVTSVSDAQDLPELSASLERKYPPAGQVASTTFVHEELHDGHTIPQANPFRVPVQDALQSDDAQAAK